MPVLSHRSNPGMIILPVIMISISIYAHFHLQAVYDFAGSHEEATFCIKLLNHDTEILNSTNLTLLEAGITGRVLLTMNCIEVNIFLV